MLETTQQFNLKNLFDDYNYAWRLLQAQISLEMSPTVTGQQIAKLLQLYMKGVQKLNSISDQRQSYFKNKVTSLMTKGVVIKSLKQNPMKKKTKHQQVSCKQQIKPKQQKLKQPQQITNPNRISHIQLKQKQKQFEMRVQYSRQENNPDTLRRLMLQQQCREQNITKKISSIIDNHEERLKQRIKQRKLRTATYRTQSVFNQQSQTQPSTNKFNSNRKQDLYFFQPADNYKLQSEQKINRKNTKDIHKKWKSLQGKKCIQQNVRKRKYTIDLEL